MYAGLVGFVAEPGKILEGRYALRAQLGHGGMGHVWRAEHTKLKTPIAVKLVAPSLVQSAEARARFLREAQVAASLDSPNIVRITDFGIEDDTPFIAMELLEGETLGARLARGAISPEATLRIFSQLARGISRAHQARVVHCDLKPENVFLARVDGEEVAKIVDFGVAKAPLLDPLTQTGAVLGTLQYMSPEQLEGRKNVGAASDLYSLAVIVFECICGQPAFRGDSIAELVRRICGAPLPMPSKIARVPAGFDAWFARAAHRDPAARFASAREMNEALVAAFERASSRSAVAVSVSAPNVALQATLAASHAFADAVLPTRRGGDERAGFAIRADRKAHMLHLEFWGLWDMTIGRAFRTEVLAAYAEMGKTTPWVVLSNARRYMPQKEEIQALHKATIAVGFSMGLARVAALVDTALSQMQIRRMFEEAGSPPNLRFFTDEEDAREWLAERTNERRGGDESAGFRVTPDTRTRIVEIERWGLWNVAIASDFKTQLLEVCELMKSAPWAGLSFASRHPPQSAEVQRLQGDTMAVAKSYGCARAAMVAESALAAMMVRRLTQENHMDIARVFTDEREARAWLAEGGFGAKR